MSRRFRWEQPLSGSQSVTVTRVAGDHEHGQEPERRYTLAAPEPCRIVATSTGVDTRTEGDKTWCTVSDGAGLAWVRVDCDGDRTRLFLPGPSFDEACTATLRGEESAARTVLAAVDSPVELPFAVGQFLEVDALVDLLGAVVASSDRASDALHAARYPVVRAAVTTTAGLRVERAATFERLVDGLDAVDEIGDVDVLDALADAIAVAHESVGETRAFLDDLGYDLSDLIERGDGRFLAHFLAQAARTGGVQAAKQFASRAARGNDTDFEDAKARAQRADYWDRGSAWRAVVRPAASRSTEEFAYVLANALYWTGEVGRTDAQADELLHEGAAAVSSTIDLEWITAHARFERCRAAAHRHRSASNHALALDLFERAIDLAEAHAILDPWEPTYSQAVVASNRHSAAGDHQRAVAVVEDAIDTLADEDVPSDRYDEMVHHLRGQAGERRAKLVSDDESRLAHLEAALDHYQAIGFDRSVDRIEAKLADATVGTETAPNTKASDHEGPFAGGPRPRLRPEGEVGPSLSDIPDLHDFLTEPDTTAVGSADPGILPDERRTDDESRHRPWRDEF
jgi:hypothetical protein